MRTVGLQYQQVNNPCPICGFECEKETKDTCTIYVCSVCGRFQLQDFADPVRLTEHHKLILRHYFSILGEKDERRLKTITNENVNEIVESVDYPKNLPEKIDRVLAYIANKTKYFGETISIDNVERISRILFCFKTGEFYKIIQYLIDKNYLTAFTSVPDSSSCTFNITMEGLERYQKNIIPKLKTKQCFVAMWFNPKEKVDAKTFRPDMQNVYSVAIKPAIEFENKYTSIRIDNIEYCNDINDEMISQIRKSKFMVADLTGYRGGVYWEAGFAEGLGIPVIYTCHKKWLNTDEDLKIEGVHFDVNHKNMILWNDDNLEEFKQKLINRIGTVIV